MYDNNQCNYILQDSPVVVRQKQEILSEANKDMKIAYLAISICENEIKFY
jgi:hypothetical protein